MDGTLQNPQNCVEAVRPVIAGLGERIERVYVACGEHDMVGMVEMPNTGSMTAFA